MSHQSVDLNSTSKQNLMVVVIFITKFKFNIWYCVLNDEPVKIRQKHCKMNKMTKRDTQMKGKCIMVENYGLLSLQATNT